MTRGEKTVTAFRWAVVAVYAAFAVGLCSDGTSAGDFTALTILAGIALVAILTADWINHGVPPGTGYPCPRGSSAICPIMRPGGADRCQFCDEEDL